MRVEIQRDETTRPTIYENAVMAYDNNGWYCVVLEDDKGNRSRQKIDRARIFRVIESDY